MNEWMTFTIQYFRYTFIISIIFLSNILCWYSIPMKSSVSIRSLASWRKCRCSTLLCASFIFSLFYQFAIIIEWLLHTIIPLYANVCTFPGWNAIHFLMIHNTIITCCFTSKVTVYKSKSFKKNITQSIENDSSQRMKLLEYNVHFNCAALQKLWKKILFLCTIFFRHFGIKKRAFSLAKFCPVNL